MFRGVVFCIFLIILATLSGAKAREIDNLVEIAVPGKDWMLQDRLDWDNASLKLTASDLDQWIAAHSGNTFIASVPENTKAGRSAEYATIAQRHSYYDYMSYYLEFRAAAPLREVRFFHAATSVTGQMEIGFLKNFGAGNEKDELTRLARVIGATKESIDTLTEINTTLFEQNVDVLRRTIYIYGDPRDPRVPAPRDVLTGLDFDLAMVEFEQAQVERYIDRNGVSSARLTNINEILSWSFKYVSTIGMTQDWVKKAGFTKRDFSDKGWRIAVGRALVFLFHKRGEQDYLDYMKEHPTAASARPALYDAIQPPDSVSRETTGSFTVVGSWRTEKGALRHLADLRNKHPLLEGAVFPPYGNSKYWMVAISAFAPGDTAEELASKARKLGVAKDAYVLTLHAIDQVGNPFQIAPKSVEVEHGLKLLEDAPVSAASSAQAMFSVFKSSSIDEANAFIRHWQLSYPEVDFGLYSVDGVYNVALAAYANLNQLVAAQDLARKLGLPVDGFSTIDIAAAMTVERLGNRAAETWKVVTDCYTKGNVSAQELHDCSGLWVSPNELTRCFLENSCKGFGDDLLPTAEDAKAFLAKNGITSLDGKIVVDIAGLPIPTDAKKIVNGIQSCRDTAGGTQTAFLDCLTKNLGPDQTREAASCLASSQSTEAAFDCLASAGALGDIGEKAACFKADYQDAQTLAVCLSGSDGAQKIVAAADCIETARSQAAILVGCLSDAFPDEQRELVECLAGSDFRSSQSAALCVLGKDENGQKVAAAIACAESSTDATGAVSCLAQVAGGDAAKVAACLASASSRAAALCMLKDNENAQAALKVYDCVTNGTSAASVIANCNGGLLKGDAQKIATCVASGSSVEGIAACAGAQYLPPEIASIASCAMQSESGVGVALCVAGPKMNAEWRIAAECAATSGGEPLSFAGCTAGRLTVRELLKCLNGKIGESCFGPNNTIVKAFNDVGDVLDDLFGGDTEFGKAIQGVADVVSDIAEGAGDFFEDVGDTICGWLGC